MMAKVVVSKARVFVRFTNIHRHPFAIGKELGPTMVAVDRTVVAFRRNGGANGEPGRNPDRSGERDKISVEIGAIARTRIARINGITLPPPGPVFSIAELIDDMIVEG